MRVAVVGHVEWVEFARVDHVPVPGEIVHALETWEEPAGGGAVAAVQLSRLAGECLFLTALGDDELSVDAVNELLDLSQPGQGLQLGQDFRLVLQDRGIQLQVFG